jgi:hypothetical protein
MDSMDQYMASAADTVVTKAKNICTAFPNVCSTCQQPDALADDGRRPIILLLAADEINNRRSLLLKLMKIS